MEKLIRATYNDEIVYPILRWILTNGNKCLIIFLILINISLYYTVNYNDSVSNPVLFLNIGFSVLVFLYLLISLMSYETYSCTESKYEMLIFKSYLIEENIREIELKIKNNNYENK